MPYVPHWVLALMMLQAVMSVPCRSGEPDVEVVEEVDDIGSIVDPDDIAWIEVGSIMPTCHHIISVDCPCKP